jgi:hypothetical protein
MIGYKIEICIIVSTSPIQPLIWNSVLGFAVHDAGVIVQVEVVFCFGVAVLLCLATTVTQHSKHAHFSACRDIHNVFGYYYHLATAEGLLHRGTDVQLFGEHGDRPFVLSRAFFSGALFVGFSCCESKFHGPLIGKCNITHAAQFRSPSASADDVPWRCGSAGTQRVGPI